MMKLKDVGEYGRLRALSMRRAAGEEVEEPVTWAELMADVHALRLDIVAEWRVWRAWRRRRRAMLRSIAALKRATDLWPNETTADHIVFGGISAVAYLMEKAAKP